MHAIITSCSCVICMDLTVCHKQIEEKWRQQINMVAEHELKDVLMKNVNSELIKYETVWILHGNLRFSPFLKLKI